MFEALGRLVNRHGLVIVLCWLAAAVSLWYLAPDWNAVAKDDDVTFFPADYPSVIGQKVLIRGFPDDISSSSAVIVVERQGERLTTDDLSYVNRLTAAVRELADDDGKPSKTDKGHGIRRVLARDVPSIGSRFLSPATDKGQAALIVAQLRGTYVSRDARLAVDKVNAVMQRQPPPEGLNLGLTGPAVVGRDTNDASKRSVDDTTIATVTLVIAILLIVYRSPLLALIPMGTIALSAAISIWAIILLAKVPGLNFQVINITNVFVIVVLFGAGTDYCLFLIARYREELARGLSGEEALSEAIRQIGGALVASAGTVILGLGMLWFSTFRKIQYTGPAIALSLVIALLASLTLAPVLLHWLRGLVFWPFKPPHHISGADPEQEGFQETPLFGFWSRVGDVVVRHPGWILGASLAVLAPFAVIGARTRPSYDLLSDLGPEQPSIIGARMFQRYFAVGDLGPTVILTKHPDVSFHSVEGQKKVEAFAQTLLAIPNVGEVRAVSRPLGTKIPLEGIARRLGLAATAMLQKPPKTAMEVEQQIFDHYVSTKARDNDNRDHITRIEVVFQTSPFALASLRTLEEVRAALAKAIGPGGVFEGASAADTGITGTSSLVHDLKKVTIEDQRRMYWLVTIGVYVILVVLLRRPIICLYLIATVILGYLASLGITELAFRAMHTGPDPWSGLDWKVGFFLFVILVAVGEDYNIFLMARVIEEERKHGPIEGTRRAVAHTGGIISSCGVIMAGTFGSMLFGSLTTLKELGFALGLGVLLDTFIVRPILVPAFVVLIHRSRPGERIVAPMIATDEGAKPAPAEIARNGQSI